MGPIKPGDRFFSVSANRRPRLAWVVVKEVGRKWARYVTEGYERVEHFGGRFDLETFAIDGGRFGAPGRVYRTEEEYHTKIRTAALWDDFRRRIDRSFTRPAHLTDIAILKAADALGMKLESE